VAFATTHALPQAPQLLASIPSLTSQPSVALPLQSAKPALHAATAHLPAPHDDAALGSLQATPHAPQFVGSERVFVHDRLQLVSPAPQAVVQAPSLQTSVPEQAVPHPPQLATLFRKLTSHPSVAMALQSAKPALHAAIEHWPETQAAVEWATAQMLPQLPQFSASRPVFTSQPSAATALQSANPASHCATTHWPAEQAGVARGTLHALPHAPQLEALALRLTQVPVQSVSPVRHDGAAPPEPPTPPEPVAPPETLASGPPLPPAPVVPPVAPPEPDDPPPPTLAPPAPVPPAWEPPPVPEPALPAPASTLDVELRLPESLLPQPTAPALQPAMTTSRADHWMRFISSLLEERAHDRLAREARWHAG
jgi:hypothetical protein